MMHAALHSLGRNQGRILLFLALIIGSALSLSTGNLYWHALGPLCILVWLGLRSVYSVYLVLLFSIPLSAEIQFRETLGTDLPDEPLMWLMTVLLFFHALSYRQRLAEIKMDRLLFYLLIAHLGWSLIAASLSPDPLISLKYVAAKTWYIVAFAIGTWYLASSSGRLKQMAWVLIIPMTWAVIWVLYTHGISGFGFDTVNDAVQPYFRNHVNYGALLVCLLPIPFALWGSAGKYRPLLFLAICLWIVAIAFSYSRGAWLAAGVGLLAVLAMRYRLLLKAAVGCVVISALVTGYFLWENRYLDYRPNFERTIYHKAFGEHMKATYQLTDLSTAERFHRWIAGTRMVADAPFFGHGPNRFFDAYQPYTVSAFRTYVSANPEKSTVHNYFLLILTEQGIPGLLIFMFLLWRMVFLLEYHYRKAGTNAQRTLWLTAASMLCMILVLNMLSDLIETDKIGSLFFIIAGLLLGGNRLSGRMHGNA